MSDLLQEMLADTQYKLQQAQTELTSLRAELEEAYLNKYGFCKVEEKALRTYLENNP